MDQSELYGRVIKVNQAKAQKDANEGLGSKTAIWEQVSVSTIGGEKATILLKALTGRLCYSI